MTDPTRRVLLVYRYNERTADGGSAYERTLLDVLAESFLLEVHAIVVGGPKISTYLQMAAQAVRFRHALQNNRKFGTVIETMDSSLIPVRSRQTQ